MLASRRRRPKLSFVQNPQDFYSEAPLPVDEEERCFAKRKFS